MHLQRKTVLLLSCIATRWLVQGAQRKHSHGRAGWYSYSASSAHAMQQIAQSKNAGYQVARLLRVQGSSQQITFSRLI